MTRYGQHSKPSRKGSLKRETTRGLHDRHAVERCRSARAGHEGVALEAPAFDTVRSEGGDIPTKESGSVAHSTAAISMATLVSRGTGFLRTWATAFALGNTVITSAYQVANDMPNMVFELVAGGLLSTAFLPIYLRQREKGEHEADVFGSNILSISLLLLGIITLLATVFAPQIMFTQTFMTGGEDQQLATFFFRIFAIQIMFYGVGGIIGGILNARRRFVWPALGPVFNNIVVIVTMFGYVPISALDPQFAMVWLAVGTSVGVFVQVGVQVPALVRTGFRWRPHIDWHDPALKEAVHLAVPALVFTIMNLACVSVMNAFALDVSSSGPSSLYYARLWYQLPYGVLAVALSTAMFTEMSESVARGDKDAFRANVRAGLRSTFFLIIPMATLLVIMAPLLITLYHAGQFTADDIGTVASILMWWGVCLPFYSGYLYLYFAFSALRKLKVVTIVNVFASLLQMFLYAFLSEYIPRADGSSGLGLIGIPISDAIFFSIMFFVLLGLLYREVGSFGGKQVLVTIAKVSGASGVGGICGFAVYRLLPSTSSIGLALLEIVIITVVTLSLIYLICALMRIPEMRMLKSLGRKLARRLGHADARV